jgi:hypothetical protein
MNLCYASPYTSILHHYAGANPSGEGGPSRRGTGGGAQQQQNDGGMEAAHGVALPKQTVNKTLI